MLFLFFFKPKLSFTEKTNAFPAFPAFAEVGATMPFKYSAFTIGIPEKAGKAGKAWVFSVKFNLGLKKNRKSIGFLSEIAYRDLQLAKKHGFLSVFCSCLSQTKCIPSAPCNFLDSGLSAPVRRAHTGPLPYHYYYYYCYKNDNNYYYYYDDHYHFHYGFSILELLPLFHFHFSYH